MASDGEVTNLNSNGGPQFVHSTLVNCSLTWDERSAGSLRCQKWLSTIKHWEHHGCISLLQDSGQWLLDSQEYHEWRNSQTPSILWLHGIPRSGKTHLVACVINDIRSCHDHSRPQSQLDLAYFYCSRNIAEAERSKPGEIIRSLLGQLAFRKSNPQQLRPLVEKFYNQKHEQAKSHHSEEIEKLSVNECESLLIELIQEQRTVLIIDALDEVDPRLRYILRTALRHIIERLDKSPNFKLFVSSRDDEDIVSEFQGYKNIYISATDNKKDIERFVDAEVKQAVNYGRILGGKRLSDQLHKEINTVLITKANGMFRWVSLQIDALCNPSIRSQRGLKDVLYSLPVSLKDSYDAIYSQILAQDQYSKSFAKHAILLLLYPFRQLDLHEFLAAVVAGVRRTEHENEDLPTPKELVGWCCNLVVITTYDASHVIPELVHLSVREYFEDKEEYRSNSGHTYMLCSSITALLCQNPVCQPFYSYAKNNWEMHSASLDRRPSGEERNLASFFLYSEYSSDRKKHTDLQDWVEDCKSRCRSNKLGSYLDLRGHAFLAACMHKIPWILDDLSELKTFDWRCRYFGHDNGKVIFKESGLISATSYNNPYTVKFLLENSVQPSNTVNIALEVALREGYMECAKILISRGADIKMVSQSQVFFAELARLEM